MIELITRELFKKAQQLFLKCLTLLIASAIMRSN